MPTTVHYGECPRCHRIKGFPLASQAREFEEQCAKADDAAPKAYTAKHDPKVQAVF